MAYADTQVEIAVPGDTDFPTGDRRGRRVRYANVAMQFVAAQCRIFEFASTKSSPEVRRCIALAMCLPGIRRRIAALGREVTIFLPSSGNIRDMLRTIQGAGHASAYRESCQLHVVAGQLQLNRDELFRPSPSRGGGGVLPPQAQLIEARVPNPQQGTATGKVLSYPYLIEDDVVIDDVELDYGNTAGMLRRLSPIPEGREAAAEPTR